MVVHYYGLKYLIEEKHCNDESGRNDRSGMSSFPDMFMVQRHVVLNTKNDSKQDDNVDHLQWLKKEYWKEDGGKEEKVVGLEMCEVAYNLQL